MLDEYIKDNVLFIVPYAVREEILKKIATKKGIFRISFLSLEEFIEHYLFKIKREEALFYLLEKKEENLSILKEKLALLYLIDPKKNYKNKKLKELQKLYQELEENHFLEKDLSFKNYLKNYEICVLGYPYLENYQKAVLEEVNAQILSYEEKFTYPPVHAFKNQEMEIALIASKIKELHDSKKIPYKKIILANVKEDDVYLITQIFKDFQIPVTGLVKHNLYATGMVKNYLKTLNSSDVKDMSVRKKIVSIENRLLHIPKDNSCYRLLLEDALRETYLDEVSYQDAVAIMDFYHLVPLEDTMVFVIGFNQNILPKVFKDENYLSDSDIQELNAMTSLEKNKKYKEVTKHLLKSIPNLFLSYRISAFSGTFYPSSCILEEGMQVIENDKLDYQFSRIYSSIQAGEMLDKFYTYGEKHEDLEKLLGSIEEFPYQKYQHQYRKVSFQIPKDTPYYLSYTSLNDYALCKFKFYAKNILKLDSYEQTFPATLGSIYHEVLRHIYDASFDFESKWNEVISRFELSQKEHVLLKRLKKELAFIIPVIEEQDSKSAFSKRLFEQKIEIPLGDNVFLKGFIDKISFCELYGTNYYAIYDYKTGSVTLDLDHIKDGLYLQLPLYQVLLEKSKLLPHAQLTGLFYQQLLLPSKDQKTKLSNLKLRGYVTDNEEALSIFDETYENSEVIKGLKVTQNGFSKNSKILTEEESLSMLNQTYEQILKMKDEILQSDFIINPKRLKGENISCKYCPFKDVCFQQEEDVITLGQGEEVEQ